MDIHLYWHDGNHHHIEEKLNHIISKLNDMEDRMSQITDAVDAAMQHMLEDLGGIATDIGVINTKLQTLIDQLANNTLTVEQFTSKAAPVMESLDTAKASLDTIANS